MRRPATRPTVRRAMLGALFGVVAAVLASAGVLAPAGSASAAGDDPIELSSDGIVWAPYLTGGLFDDFQGAVPGDSSTKSFFVRNPEDFAVTMKTRALDVVSTTAGLANSLTVQGSAGGVSLAAPVLLSSLGDCATLAPDFVLAPHATTRVSITLTLPESISGSTAQASRGGFDVLLTMQDDAAGTPDASCGTDDGGTGGGDTGGGGTGGGGTGGGGTGGGGSTGGGGHHSSSPTVTPTGGYSNPLAFTGVDGAAALLLGGALLLLGFLLLIVRRRRRTENQEQ